MKSKSFIYVLMCISIPLLFFVTSCTKEGPPGLDGIDGFDGTEGTASCVGCHNSANKADVNAQYALSGHAAGLFVGYAGARQGCAMCHSNEGFIETQATGQDTTLSADGIPLPTAIGCETCHEMHNSFDFETDGPDYALRTSEPVSLLMTGHTTSIDLGGSSNLCANCHQPRRAGPVDDGTGNYKITSSHYGPHHGPQSTILEGIGGYEISGSLAYPAPQSATHRKSASCTTCHMGDFSNDSGGHTWHPNIASCTTCHDGATDFDINGVQAEVLALMEDLKTALQGKGVLDSGGHVVKGTYPVDHAGAFYNYAAILDDRSNGVHNPDYIIALLTNSIEALQ